MDKAKKLSDEELVSLVCSGKKELYEEVVQRYQNKLIRYVRYLIKDAHTAEDVVQDVFIKAFINLRGFNPKKQFSSWIYRIAHNEAINAIKKQKKLVFLSKEGWHKFQPKSCQDIHNDLANKERQKQVLAQVKQLPLKYREPFILFHLEEKSYKEISDILRLSVGGVGTRINRAKKILKNYLNAKDQ